MEGDLTKDGLPDVLRRIYTNRASGELKLTQSGQRKSVYFELGAIVFASSNAKSDRIGETMIRHGMLSQEDFDRASAMMTRGKRFGRILVELGICSEQDLLMNVTFQILDIIYSVFDWTAGHYEFIHQEKSVPDDLRLDLSTASIILEGVRRIQDFDVIQRGLGDLNRLIGPTTNPLLRLQTLSLKPLERQVIEIVTEPMNILKVMTMVKSTPDTVLRALYGLISSGVLERFGAPEINSKTGKLQIPKKLYEQAAQAQPIVPPKVAQAAAKTGEVRVAEMLNKVRARLAVTQDPYEILGVTRQSTREEIRDAYYALAKDFHPDRHQGAAREVRQEVEQIFSRLTNCYETLRQHTPAKPVPPPPSAPTTSSPNISSAPAGSSGVTGPLGTPYGARPVAGETAAQREQRAEAMYLEARNRYISKDYQYVIHTMREVVKLNSTQSRYHLLLGTALSMVPKTMKEAEPVLRKAIELDPFNAVCRSNLGQLYLRAGMPRQAEKEFEEALKLDNNLQSAIRGLESIRSQNSEGGFLGKLFKK
ncbi:MAG: DUF4388 domain-containing protein [Blastocatellia bacterium]|nr:DUF4388 domain-containing protein [Blastocatellia bacterium]